MTDELEKAARESLGSPVPQATVAAVSQGGNPGSPIGWFGPGKPLTPVAPADVAGRQFDFPTHYNLAIQPRAYEGTTFAQLRALADNYDLLRLIIETRKDQVESYGWEIQAKKGKKVSQAVIDKANEFFQYPDKEHPWCTWIRMLLEDVFVLDAAAIYPRLTRGGELYSMELMAPDFLKRVLDDSGRTPLPPDPAYQQVLKGLPAVNYTREEILYWMRNPRTNRVYGYSPVEQIIMTVNIAMRRQIHQLGFYTEGNVPEALVGVPDTWSVKDVAQFQEWWDSLMEGNLAERRKMKFLPVDPTKVVFPKADALKDMYDEWLARIVCFAFSISPTALVKETNRSVAESVQDAAKMEGVTPLLNWLKTFLDFCIQRKYNQPDLEFSWLTKKDLEPAVQAAVDKIYLDAKVILPEEVRERLALPKLTPEQEEKLNPPPPPQLVVPGEEPGKPAPGKPVPGKPVKPGENPKEVPTAPEPGVSNRKEK